MKANHLFLIPFMLAFFTACVFEKDDNGVRVDGDLARMLLSEAADTVIIDEKHYILEAELWRDLMPGTDLDRSLISVNKLVLTDSTQIPSHIDLTKQYVIRNDTIWISDYTDDHMATEPYYKLERLSSNGPEWTPGIFVDVVAEIINMIDGSICLIKRTDIQIFAAY